MDIISNLWLGLQTAASATNLLYCLIGVFLGTAIGVLPGLGPVATIAMLLPVTFGLPPISALIMLAGIYYGAQYGGSTTAILVNLPGESSSVVPPLAEVALSFGPAEYFSLMVLGLVASIVLAHGSLLHALGMIIFGLLLGLIGTDVNSGVARFSFNLPELADGINFVVVAMGVFGLGEIIGNLEHEASRSVTLKKVTGLMPSKE